MKRGGLGMLIAWCVVHVLAALVGERRDDDEPRVVQPSRSAATQEPARGEHG